MTRKGEKAPYMESSRDNCQKEAYISNELQLQNHSPTSIQKNK